MATRAEILKGKMSATHKIAAAVRKGNGELVDINALYEKHGKQIWGFRSNFLKDFRKLVDSDIKVIAKPKYGSKAMFIGPVDTKTLTMGGVVPKIFEGVKVDHYDVSGMVKVTKPMKMFAVEQKETEVVFRHKVKDGKFQYLQRTTKGDFLFSQVEA